MKKLLLASAVLSGIVLAGLFGVSHSQQALGGTGTTASGQFLTISPATTTASAVWLNSNGVLVAADPGPPPPTGALYHQVVDTYFDGAGNKLESHSATHAVGYNCHPGLRKQDQDLVVQDDGHGNVQFTVALLPNEPAPEPPHVTLNAEARRVMVIMAASSRRDTDSPPPITAPTIATTTPEQIAQR
jgi:hypothetical protein